MDHGGDEFLNCTDCMMRLNKKLRRGWRCGWLPQDSWTGDAMAPGHLPKALEPTVCAGYSTQMPEVLECGRAMSWRDKGCLPDMYGGELPPPALRDGIDILAVEQAAVDSFRMKKVREGQG